MPPKRAFVALQDRFVSSLAVACCPTMDLVAVLTLDHHLLVHRTTSWQKLLHVKPSDVGLEMVTLAWRPDGLQLAVGCDEGDVAIFEIESGEILPERRSSFSHEHCITTMHWTHINELGACGASSNNKRRHRKISGSLRDDWRSLSKLHFQRRSARFLKGYSEDTGGNETVLVTADDRGFIAVWWMGRVLLTRIDVSKHFSEDEYEVLESSGYQRGDTSGFRIERVVVAPDLSLLFVLIGFYSGDRDQNTEGTQSEVKVHRLLTLDMAAIQLIHEDVALVASTIDRVHTILTRMATAGKQMATEWKNAMRIFELKMGLIGSLYEKYACEDPPQVDMLSVVVTGITAPALAQYFAQDIQEMSVHRMEKALFNGCDALRILADEKVKHDLVDLLFLSSELRGHAKWNPQVYADSMGITVDALDELVQITQDSLLEVETLTLALHETRQDFALFFQWILERIRIHTDSTRSGGGAGAAGAARDTGGATHGSKSLLNLRRLCDFLRNAADFAQRFRKQQPSHSAYRVETTFGNPVSQQLSTRQIPTENGTRTPSVGCLTLIQRLHEKWSSILSSISVSLSQIVVRERSGCFTVSTSSNTVEECHIRFRQPFSTTRSDDIADNGDQSEDEEDDEEAVDWNSLKHYGPIQDGLDNCSTILIGLRLQSGILLLLRAFHDTDPSQLRHDPPIRLSWETAVVSFSQGPFAGPVACHGFDFYGDVATNKKERLAFRVEEGQLHQEWLYLQQYDSIEFARSNPGSSFEVKHYLLALAIIAQGPTHTFELDQARGRLVASLPTAAHSSKSSTSVIATASRGVLCVILPSSRLAVFDAEDSEDDDHEGEGDDGDEDI